MSLRRLLIQGIRENRALVDRVTTPPVANQLILLGIVRPSSDRYRVHARRFRPTLLDQAVKMPEAPQPLIDVGIIEEACVVID
jgi:hypothetical protein